MVKKGNEKAAKKVSGDVSKESLLPEQSAEGDALSLRRSISIIGLMGAGKTTVGSLFAECLGVPFIDADEQVERLAGKSISDIFKDEGEAAFRRQERETIIEILENAAQPIVLSTGGGAFLNEQTRRVLKQKTCVVWLKAAVETLLSRVSQQSHRPLLNVEDKRSVLERLVDERYPVYALADIVLETDSYTREAAVRELMKLLADHTIY